MDIFLIFKIISFLFVLWLVIFSWNKIADKKAKRFFAIMMFFSLFSTVFYFPDGNLKTILGEETIGWIKHILFYASQLYFYFFILRLIKIYAIKFSKKIKTNIVEEVNSMLSRGSAFAVFTLAIGLDGVNIASKNDVGFSNYFNFLYDNGIDHVIALPFLFLIICAIRVKYLYIESKIFKYVLNLFMLAAMAFTLVHVSEFVIEGQKLLPVYYQGEFMAMIEFIWFYLGLFLFSLAIRKYNQLRIGLV